MSKKSFLYIALGLVVFTPVIAFAQPKTLGTVINIVIGYFNQILVLMVGLAIVFFVWYVIKYFIRPNEERKEAGQYVMYSLIGFFVILSVWGLVNILQNTFGLDNSQPSWSSFKGLFPGDGTSGTSGQMGGFQRPNSSTGVMGGNQTPVDPCPDGSASGPDCQ